MRTKYEVVQFSQQKSDSKGVGAGMWGVVRIRKETVGFGDERSQAEALKSALKASDKSAVDDDDLF